MLLNTSAVLDILVLFFFPVEGIESVEIVQMSNVISLETELDQNAVDVTVTCQGRWAKNQNKYHVFVQFYVFKLKGQSHHLQITTKYYKTDSLKNFSSTLPFLLFLETMFLK